MILTKVYGDAASDVIRIPGGEPPHDLAPGRTVVFSRLDGGAGLTAGTTYYVLSTELTPRTFKVSATLGGAAVNFTTEITSGYVDDVAPPAPLTTPAEVADARGGYATLGAKVRVGVLRCT